MTEGLITRIGKWIDNKWESKVTESQLEQHAQECRVRYVEAQKAIQAITTSDVVKDLTDLKTRMEKMELYAGMTRKVDPTKPPIVKSAFQM